MIGRLGAEQLDRVEPLWQQMVVHHDRVVDGAWPLRSPADAWRRRRTQYAAWLADGSGSLLVATAPDGADDGYAMVRVGPSGPTWDHGELIGDLESLVVAERARGAGLGTRLIDAARSLLAERGVAYWTVSVIEANAGATRLYEREGFRPFFRSLLAPVDVSSS